MTPSSNHLYSPTISFKTLQTFRYFRGNRKEMSVYRFRKKIKTRPVIHFCFLNVFTNQYFLCMCSYFLYLEELMICLRFLGTFEIAPKLLCSILWHRFDIYNVCTIMPPFWYSGVWSTKAHHTFKWIKKSHAWDRHLVKITLKTHLVCVILNESFTN